MIINDSVSKKCLTIFEILENYFFENFPLYGMIIHSYVLESQTILKIIKMSFE